MTEQDIERKLRTALEHTAPDGLDRLLSRLDDRKGAEKMENIKTGRRKRWIGILAACLAVAMIGGAGGFIYGRNYAVATVVSLDVNPSIELRVNSFEKVISCTGLNDEGREVLSSMSGGADLKGAKLNVAVNAITGAIVRAGYLDDLGSAILISVEDRDTERGSRLQAQLVAEVDGVLKSAASAAGVLSQSITSDRSLAAQAQENNISSGKASFVNQVLALNPYLDFSTLATLSVEELRGLIQAGAPAMPIGRQEAERLAREAAANDGAGNIITVDVDPELDSAVPHYEVEVLAEWELEYKFDAFTGKLLNIQNPTYQNPNTQRVITSTDATAAALDQFRADFPDLDLGLVRDLESKYNGDSNTYEVEFDVTGYDFEYWVDAGTGQVVGRHTDYVPTEPTAADPTQSGTPAQPDEWTQLSERALSAAIQAIRDRYPELVRFDTVKCEYDSDGHLDVEILAYNSMSAETDTNRGSFDLDLDPATLEVLAFEADYTPAATVTAPAPSGGIDPQAAKDAALSHAGITEGDVTFVRVEPDTENGRQVYDVEFYTADTEYDYEIDASTGQVVKQEAKSRQPAAPQTVSDVGEDAAKSAALSRAGISDAGSVTWIKCQREYDDGRLEYDMEFHCGATEYDVTVDAASGSVTKCEQETHHDDHHDAHHSGAAQTGDIGADAAKSAALTHAGLTADKVTGLKCERDMDDGRVVYEVEFKSGGFEYEYKIDAATGSVLEHERDRDD